MYLETTVRRHECIFFHIANPKRLLSLRSIMQKITSDTHITGIEKKSKNPSPNPVVFNFLVPPDANAHKRCDFSEATYQEKERSLASSYYNENEISSLLRILLYSASFFCSMIARFAYRVCIHTFHTHIYINLYIYLCNCGKSWWSSALSRRWIRKKGVSDFSDLDYRNDSDIVPRHFFSTHPPFATIVSSIFHKIYKKITLDAARRGDLRANIDSKLLTLYSIIIRAFSINMYVNTHVE